MSHILCSGWLIKSPPEHKMSRSLKLFRSQWKKRFFILSQSGRTNEAYELNYFKDKKGGKKKGSINLTFCSQVIEAAHPELFPHLLSVKTLHKNKIRKYYLAASSQVEMKEWVHWLCLVCGLNLTQRELPTLELNPARANSTLDLSPGSTMETRLGDGSARCSKVFSRVLSDVKRPPSNNVCVPEEEEPKQESESFRGSDDSGESEPFRSFINFLNESLSVHEDGSEEDEKSIQVFPKIPKPLPRKSISKNFETSLATLKVDAEPPEKDSSTDENEVIAQSYESEAEEDTAEVIYTIPSLEPKQRHTRSDYDIPSLISSGPNSIINSTPVPAPPLPHRQRVTHSYVNVPFQLNSEEGDIQ